MPIVILWLLLIAVNLAIRPLMPIDETRYVSVAWEMWVREDFLVPYLNGETYSHKPPLLFWLMQLSWAIFGVNEWTARLISPLFALGSTLLSGIIAEKLWPQRPSIAKNTPLILLGFSFWLIYSTLTMFDMLLAFFVLLAIFSIISLAQTSTWRSLFLLGIAIGGGVLSKGPVLLLQILPVAVLAPWWLERQSNNFQWRLWYLKLIAAIFIGAAIALAWALPAGISGGDDYRHAIFLGQTSGRIVDSFSHKFPFWWYLVRLPLLLLPWLLFKPFWQGIRKLSFNDYGVRFCTAWALPVFIAFSLVSGKRIHYLLPLMPALALLLARVADEIHDIARWKRAFLTVWGGVCIILLLTVSFILLNTQTHWFNITLNALWLLGLTTLIGLGLMRFKVHNMNHIMLTSCLISIAIPSALAITYLETNASRFDTKPIAQTISQLRSEDKGVAFYTGKYHDQFQFTGRLTQPLILLHSPDRLKNWIEQNKTGFVLVDSEKVPASLLYYSHIYRAGQLGFLSSQTLIEQPELIKLLPL
ncbi:MAG: hypothetical protein RLZZ66_2370 [Pseudomonadota bacterium]|jgi:4-amino-4-deoxy-L-arabinose transferase-like glycosyltransferase